ncbi:hypothetical protein EYW49_22765 [Siculibacillus lacustris]|uniref:Uncharacterized protein n=1 Tax=Siculibacillus lacustris TaxID=1549641 RepID=A0A4Q9VBY5_9HYPH|nr:hypothetical protein [Siculibacillus lacustris]TBW31854.1 hypothetical protein EYW49_22765 [Siculibacillus lacustris]
MDFELTNTLATQTGALAWSLVIEASTAAALASWTGWGTPGRAAIAAIAGTLATHGFAWSYVLEHAEVETFALVVLQVEATVVVIESLAYRLLVCAPIVRCLAFSVAANAMSAGFGLLMNGLV